MMVIEDADEMAEGRKDGGTETKILLHTRPKREVSGGILI